MSSDSAMLEEIRRIRKNFEKSLELYSEYKKLRSDIGRTDKAFNDRDAILKDLLGDGFPALQKEVERVKRRRKTQRSLYDRASY